MLIEPAQGNEALAGRNETMTNLTALIREARLNRNLAAASTFTRADGKVFVRGDTATGFAQDGNVKVHVLPVSKRSGGFTNRADVYMDGKRLKTAEVAALLKMEG